MRSDVLRRRVLLTATLVIVFATGLIVGQNKYGQPKSVIHLVTLKWKTTSTPAQQQAAIDGIKGMAKKMPGIKNISINPCAFNLRGIRRTSPSSSSTRQPPRYTLITRLTRSGTRFTLKRAKKTNQIK